MIAAITWAQVGVVAGAGVAVFTLIGMFAKVSVKVVAPHFAQAARAAIKPDLEVIRKEVEVNSGTSLKDAVNRIERDVKLLTGRFDDLHEYTHSLRHDLGGSLQRVEALINLHHPPQGD